MIIWRSQDQTETTPADPKTIVLPFKVTIRGEGTVTNPEPKKESDDGARRQP
jgi:hypothetical protein